VGAVTPADEAEKIFRAECAYWLDIAKGKQSGVDAVIERITKVRGKAAADKLLKGMEAERDRRKGLAKQQGVES
jgi:hypothetical protein